MPRSPFGRTLRYYLEDGLNEIGLGVILLATAGVAAAAALAGAALPEWVLGLVLFAGVALLGPVVRRRKERRFASGGYVEWGDGGPRAVVVGLAIGAILWLSDVVLGDAGGLVSGLGLSVGMVSLLVAYWTGLRRYAVLGAVSLALFGGLLPLEPGLLRFAAFASGLGAATLVSGAMAARRSSPPARGAAADA